MNKNAFTIIELIVTISIIVLMAVLAFPAFSKYQKKAELVQKAEELNGYINEMNVLVKNPEPGVDSYEMESLEDGADIKINFRKISASVSTSIRDLSYKNEGSLSISPTHNKITCDVTGGSCCFLTPPFGAVPESCDPDSTKTITFGDSSIDKEAIISVKNYPFSSSFKVE